MAERYNFPQSGPAMVGLVPGERGIASMHHPEVGTIRFRSNPKEFNWSYTLNKRVDQTYGGRVIQLLGTRIDDFSFKADVGNGRWAYMQKVAAFMRNVMIAQRGGVPATFEYTTRGWKFNAYVSSVPFSDAVEEVLREFEIGLKVQEDVSGMMSRSTLNAELRRLQVDVGFHRSKYNDPDFDNNRGLVPDAETDPFGIASASQFISGFTSVLTQNLSFVSDTPTVAKANNLINSIAGK
jgi:hypothetical protein